MGKRAYFRVHCYQSDVPDLKPAMAYLEFPCQIYRAAFEELPGIFVVVFLVLLDR